MFLVYWGKLVTYFCYSVLFPYHHLYVYWAGLLRVKAGLMRKQYENRTNQGNKLKGNKVPRTIKDCCLWLSKGVNKMKSK